MNTKTFNNMERQIFFNIIDALKPISNIEEAKTKHEMRLCEEYTFIAENRMTYFSIDLDGEIYYIKTDIPDILKRCLYLIKER